jgi:hypothetical protein
VPTVLGIGPYRFFFCPGDGQKPPHIRWNETVPKPTSG